VSRSSYTDAINGALQRLEGVGYEFGPSFVNHAPMAAEALARLGLTDEVPGWVEQNLRKRRYHDPPAPRWPLSGEDEADWSAALGDFSRVADWTALFERELAREPWRAVLARWWPRLLPGMSAALTHGVIRTAHAVRGVALGDGDDQLRLGELAHGLGYWAARYSGPRRSAADRPPAIEDDGAAWAALDSLIAESAGLYAGQRHSFPVPLIHSITGPAAVRLVCEHLPPEQRWPSYLVARECSEAIRGYFGREPQAPMPIEGEAVTAEQLVAAAVELGDEHAIKLAEVAVRQGAVDPDPRLWAASQVATQQIARHPF
jgi:hypothetical protein